MAMGMEIICLHLLKWSQEVTLLDRGIKQRVKHRTCMDSKKTGDFRLLSVFIRNQADRNADNSVTGTADFERI